MKFIFRTNPPRRRQPFFCRAYKSQRRQQQAAASEPPGGGKGKGGGTLHLLGLMHAGHKGALREASEDLKLQEADFTWVRVSGGNERGAASRLWR